MSPGRGVVSIVVPTSRRSDEVQPCVDALTRACARARTPVDAVFVVANGDGCEEVSVRAPEGSDLDVRVVVRPTSGASRARNHALALTDADVVVFVDDDVLVDDDWLDPLVAPLLRGDDGPEVGATVGPIRLDLEGARPRWLTPNLERWYSALDLGPETRLLGPSEYGWGANLAVRTRALAAVGGFDEGLGPGTRAPFADDDDLLDRLRARGLGVVYCADARVRHRIAPARLRWQWLVARGYRQGFARVARARRHRNRFRREPGRALGYAASVVARGFPTMWRTLRDPASRPSLVVEQLAIRVGFVGAAIASWSGGAADRPRLTPRG